MPRFAGHLPTKNFSLAEWLAMEVWPESNDGRWIPDGTYRSTLRGRPIVFHTDFLSEIGHPRWWAVRPIVRVPMGCRA